MATLTARQKKDINDLKNRITEAILTVAKIQDTTIVEQDLLQKALNYIAIDQVGNYEGRMSELNKYRYMVDGILYNHLNSKQINYGYPRSVDISAPISFPNNYEESFGPGICPILDEPV